ncbi:hypothetical protein [Cellulosimicrobium funkei]|uniref:Uncharacterized protein n=1 Tax=Cellulosimicrobium funkei TaxID=264251 RepID=A0A4Y8QYB2_9MICO|nr:hypothetical protein [Cellulosimicrobium funkei]TFF03723.1 hypothetical protein E1O70_19440 [Cellulosimicrobium funkei]TGA67365.1 hypothetical protein EQW79_019255 [Cellulosimicrobium terreum]
MDTIVQQVNEAVNVTPVAKPTTSCALSWCAHNCEWEPDGSGWSRYHQGDVDNEIRIIASEFCYGDSEDGVDPAEISILHPDFIGLPPAIGKLATALARASALVHCAGEQESETTRYEDGTPDEYWETVTKIGVVSTGEWTCESVEGVEQATAVRVQRQGAVHNDGSDLMNDGIRVDFEVDMFGSHFLSAEAARQFAGLLLTAADALEAS